MLNNRRFYELKELDAMMRRPSTYQYEVRVNGILVMETNDENKAVKKAIAYARTNQRVTFSDDGKQMDVFAR